MFKDDKTILHFDKPEGNKEKKKNKLNLDKKKL
jgi:hypothetical protein